MSRFQKNILQICLFVSIFATLLIIATFLDLQISNILASGGLGSGKYYTSNIFGQIIEYIGSFPIFFLGGFDSAEKIVIRFSTSIDNSRLEGV